MTEVGTADGSFVILALVARIHAAGGADDALGAYTAVTSTGISSVAEERGERARRPLGFLLGQEVAAVEGLVADVVGIRLPRPTAACPTRVCR